MRKSFQQQQTAQELPFRCFARSPVYHLSAPLTQSDDIEDPWYTGYFDRTYDDVLRGCEGLLKELGY